MDPLDLLLWHYIPDALIAWLCFLIWRAIIRAWLNRNELREDEQSRHAQAFWNRQRPEWYPDRNCQQYIEWKAEGRQKGFLQ